MCVNTFDSPSFVSWQLKTAIFEATEIATFAAAVGNVTIPFLYSIFIQFEFHSWWKISTECMVKIKIDFSIWFFEQIWFSFCAHTVAICPKSANPNDMESGIEFNQCLFVHPFRNSTMHSNWFSIHVRYVVYSTHSYNARLPAALLNRPNTKCVMRIVHILIVPHRSLFRLCVCAS